MSYRIKLKIEGQERGVLSFSMSYFHPSPNDSIFSNSVHLFQYQQLGIVSKEYKPKVSVTLDDCDRTLSSYQFKPKGEPLDGRLHLVMEATDHDEMFYEWLKSGECKKGILEFYNTDDEDIPFRTIEFWDAYISEISEKTQTDTNPMLLYFVISPATVKFNKSLVFQKNWYITDINARVDEVGKQEEKKQEETLVWEVKGLEEALQSQRVKYKVTRYNTNNVSDGDRKNVKWAIKVDGKQENLSVTGETIEIEIKKEWIGKEILVMAYLKSSDEKVSQKTKIKSEEQSLSLYFNGNFLLLRVVKENEILRFSYKAVSGRPIDGKFDYSIERQAKKGQGPIPEGEYHINPQEIQYTNDRSTYDKLKGVVGGGTFKGGTTSWGIGRVWIYPSQVVINGVVRSDFSIHGGSESGSAGCIDLTGNDIKFFEELMKHRGSSTKIPLIVKY
jgi:hypothetical protein